MITRLFGSPDVHYICIAQPRRRLDKGIEHGLEIEGRSADNFEHVSSGGLPLQRFGELACALLLRLEQSYVLDRDQRLIGERCHQLDLLLGEWLHDGPVSTMTPITTSSRNNGTPRMVR